MIAAELIKTCIIDVFKDTIKGEIRSTVKGGTSKACSLIKGMIRNNMLYTIDFAGCRNFYVDQMAILQDPVLLRLNLPKTMDIDFIGDEVVRRNSISIPKGEELFKLFFWHGAPIIIHLASTTLHDDGYEYCTIGIKFYTVNTSGNRHILCQFVMKLLERVENKQFNEKMARKKYTECNYLNDRAQTRHFNIQLRTFDDVFLTNEQESILIKTLDNFRDKRDWYKNNNIPYHLGILLYSEGGTGKTSIAQAICEHMKATPTFINGNTLIHLPRYLDKLKQHVTNPLDYRAVIVEDIDCSSVSQSREYASGEASREDMQRVQQGGGYPRTRNAPPEPPNLGLSDILNCLDGVRAPDNMIFIFTTNHIEKLDPALIRPGRIDVKLDIPCVTPETLAKFLKKIYNYDMPEDEMRRIKVRKHLKFAELQLEAVRGSTVEEIIKFAETEVVTPIEDPEDIPTEEINEKKKNTKNSKKS